jgi:hypothetical protein
MNVGEANLFSDSQVRADLGEKIIVPQTQGSASGTQHLDSVVRVEDLHHIDSRVPTARSNPVVRLLSPVETSQCVQIDGSSDNIQPEPVSLNDVANVEASEHVEVSTDVCSDLVDPSINLRTADAISIQHDEIWNVVSNSAAVPAVFADAISVQHDEICNVASTSAAVPVVFESHEPIVVLCSIVVLVPPIIVPAIATGNNHPCNKGFLPISEVDWKVTVEDAGQNSLKNNNWARNKFDSWRVFMGLSVDVKLEDLDLKEFGNQLSQFFLMVCKSNG